MKQVRLEDTPQPLQEAIKSYINSGYEVLQLTAEELSSGKWTYESILTIDHHSFVELSYCHELSEQILHSWTLGALLELSEPFRNRMQRRIQGIEREKDRKS